MCFQSTCRHVNRQLHDSVKTQRQQVGESLKEVRGSIVTYNSRVLNNISRYYNQYFWRLRKDRFAELAAQEQATDVYTKDKLLYVWCTDFHPASEFSTDQLATQAHERMCIGATATVYICPHKSLTFPAIIELKALRRKKGMQSPALCTEGMCRVPRLLRINKYHMDDYRGHYCIEVPYHIPFERTQASIEEVTHAGSGVTGMENWSSPIIQQGLLKLDAYVCPHLRTSDVEFYNLLLANVYEGAPYTSLRVLREGNAYWPTHVPVINYTESPYTVFIRCHADENCQAKFTITVIRESQSDSKIVVQVLRRTFLDTVRSPRWFAMIEVSNFVRDKP
jgi:hypothetical protein